ncbi:DedA family protein [Streptosporangium lutulentum]
MDPYLVGAVLLAVLALDGSPLIGAVLPGEAATAVAGTALTGPSRSRSRRPRGDRVLPRRHRRLADRPRYGSRVRHNRAGRWIGEHRWARAERLATGTGSGPALAAACFLPVVNSLTPVLAGTLGMPYHRFIRWALA